MCLRSLLLFIIRKIHSNNTHRAQVIRVLPVTLLLLVLVVVYLVTGVLKLDRN
jgi:hypothetical protein